MSDRAEWIWHNGDYEIMQLNKCLTSRYEREVFVPPFWKMDDYYKNVKFTKEFEILEEQKVFITATGKFNIIVDVIGKEKNEYVRNFNGYINLTPNKYKITVSVYNDYGLPSVFIDSKTLKSNNTFLSTCNDFNHKPVGCDGLYNKKKPPAEFEFTYKEINYDILEHSKTSILIDCKKEMMGIVSLKGSIGSGNIKIIYGESLEEATDEIGAELTDILDYPKEKATKISKAFRYINIIAQDSITLGEPVVKCEYLPQKRSAKFVSSNKLLNDIYECSLYTLQLNTREFFLDGIKRDRWVWGGDAYQSFLMNYYSFFDLKTTRRTITALAGKKPVATYINHIMEYSFYWIIGLYDYYMFTKDVSYIKRVFPIAQEFVDMTFNRKAENGLIQGKDGDWIFVDWANLDNRGQVSPEQIIFLKTLKTMIELSDILGKESKVYQEEHDKLKQNVFDKLWDKDNNVFYYSLVDNKENKDIKKHPHIFALLFDILTKEQQQAVIKNVLINDNIEKITTPYMRFYELSALCKCGFTDYVLDEILSYWGGMLAEGATSFWEVYDKNEIGTDKYAMYNRPYGKSLCHAWGASPLYLIGKYYVGLEPSSAGYTTFNLKPVLSNLEWFDAEMPLNNGSVKVEFSLNKVKVLASGANGKLFIDKKLYTTTQKCDLEDEHNYIFDIKDGEKFSAEISKRGTND